ncbi:PREDICTED: transient receptor potential cation channel protein painless-like [Wasmannia auropunctata]|uniref:transient receptor potential cation channel protein painless-like n=1 Tax=Wasmannia auropunctata TaxID=64793 RepID=UPI0005F05539|nr:PREDICTED: transient receptor potential cation channel protein painless-like [Wasmannia auropunctata]
MDFEENLMQDCLLDVYDLSPSNTDIFYKLLLDTLKAKDFHSFKNIIHNRKQPTDLNVNYVYPNTEETCLDIASRNGLTEFVQLLLHKRAKPNRINKVYNRAPIHFATEGGHVSTLEALLKESTTNPDFEAGHQTALHIAVRRNDLTCAGLLLENGASASIPNSKGLTALHLAAVKGQRDMVKLILKKSQQCPDVDTYKDYNDQTTREVIQQKLPGVSLPFKHEYRDVNVHDLKYYLIADDETNFLKSMKFVKTKISHDVAEELLEMAVQHNFYKAVIAIIQKFMSQCFNVRKAAEAAVRLSHSAILRELLYVEPKVANDLILSACQQLGIPERRKNNISDRLECLKLILEQESVDVHCTDSKGNTPLHYAARAGCAEAVTLLLNRGSYIGYKNEFNIPPIADIPACMLSRYFDNCLQIRKEWANENVIEFNYSCLMPHDVLKKHDETRQTTREVEVFEYIASNSNLKHLLKHPLLSSFLYLKWHKIRHVLYANFIFYVIFYVLLNVYILSMSSNNSPNENRMQITNDSFNISTLENPLQIIRYQDNFLWISITLLLLLFTLREILQFIFSPYHYLTNLENLLRIVLITLTFVFICGANLQIGTLLILLSAWKLIILVSQHRDMSTNFEVFRTVSVNYARLFLPYMFFTITFALTFYTLFKENTNFSDLMYSFFKTTIVLISEFEANDISFILHLFWSHITLVLFVFLIVIVLFNLLNGLAVSHIAEISSKAELIGHISWIRVVAYIENIAIDKPFYFCCGNSRLSRWNPFDFLASRIFLFPHYLRDGKINVKLYDSIRNDKYDVFVAKDYVCNESVNHDKYWTSLRMDPNIMKQAKQIILEKNQLPNNKEIMTELTKLRVKLTAMEITLNTILKFKHEKFQRPLGEIYFKKRQKKT